MAHKLLESNTESCRLMELNYDIHAGLFIGETFDLGDIHVRIMHACVAKIGYTWGRFIGGHQI